MALLCTPTAGSLATPLNYKKINILYFGIKGFRFFTYKQLLFGCDLGFFYVYSWCLTRFQTHPPPLLTTNLNDLRNMYEYTSIKTTVLWSEQDQATYLCICTILVRLCSIVLYKRIIDDGMYQYQRFSKLHFKLISVDSFCLIY